MELSRKREYRHPLHLGVVAIEKGAFMPASTTVANFTFYWLQPNRLELQNTPIASLQRDNFP